jgi:hypothetical protein
LEHYSLSDIPDEQLAAVRRYINTDFAMVDTVLRTLDHARLKELDEFIRQVTYGLFQLPSFRGVVYRGTTLSDKAARHYVPGHVVFERSFVSATADPARRYPGNTTFVIASVNGRDVSPLSDSPEEQEVVFFTGTWFKVLATEQDVTAGELYIYLAEIPDRRLLQEAVAQ